MLKVHTRRVAGVAGMTQGSPLGDVCPARAVARGYEVKTEVKGH